MVLPLLQDGEAVLRQDAEPVPDRLFGTPELEKIIRDMAETVDRESDGVAIAAPQVGIPYRIFLVRYDRMEPYEDDEERGTRTPDIGVYINPKIDKVSRKSIECDEGCLSVRGIYGKTTRRARATVTAYDMHGSKFTRGAGGLLAQAFQHEVDHLNGVLFVDHASTTYTLRDKDDESSDE